MHVPVLVGPVYFGLGCASWLCASVVLDEADERLDLRERIGKFNLVVLPMPAAAVITMFDVAADRVDRDITGAALVLPHHEFHRAA